MVPYLRAQAPLPPEEQSSIPGFEDGPENYGPAQPVLSEGQAGPAQPFPKCSGVGPAGPFENNFHQKMHINNLLVIIFAAVFL